MSESPYTSGTTHFGFRDVAAKDKQKLVGEVFTSVARNYDLMNDLMSLGIHRAWKRYFVATAQVKPGDRVLDLAGGTGDIAVLLKERVGNEGAVVLGDINAGMLSVGRDRLTNRGLVAGFDYVQCNAEALPFPDQSFDLVTISFGLRNVTDKDAALREMYRVLKVGGRHACSNFPKSPPTGSSRSTTSIRSRSCPSWASCSRAMPTATSTWPRASASTRRRIRSRA